MLLIGLTYRSTNQTSKKNNIFINIQLIKMLFLSTLSMLFLSYNDGCTRVHFKIKHNSVYCILESEDIWKKYSEICHI